MIEQKYLLPRFSLAKFTPLYFLSFSLPLLPAPSWLHLSPFISLPPTFISSSTLLISRETVSLPSRLRTRFRPPAHRFPPFNWLRSHLWPPFSLFRGRSPRVTAPSTVTNDPRRVSWARNGFKSRSLLP